MTLTLQGVYTALVTPFTADGATVDYDAYERLLALQLEGGVNGLVPCGTTGEAPTLSDAEQREVIARTVKAAKGRAVVVAGTGSNNTKKTIEASRAAFDVGADAVMVVMPYYSKPSQEGLFQHSVAVAQAVSGPVILYNVPGRTVAELTVDTLLRIADACPNVVGLKDASGNAFYCQEVTLRAPGRLSVLSGDDPLTLPLLACGATGVISVTSNLYPRQVGDVIRSAQAGRWAEALKQNLALYNLHRALFSEPSPSPIKAALELKGVMSGAVRLPLVAATDACRGRLSELIKAYEAR